MRVSLRPHDLWHAALNGALTRLKQEELRWSLWLPVPMGIGIVVYFAQAAPLPFMWICGLLLIIFALWALCYKMVLTSLPNRLWTSLFIGFLIGWLCLLGMAVSAWQVLRQAAPILSRPYEGEVIGRVVEIAGERLLLDKVQLQGYGPLQVPEKIRVRFYGQAPAPLTFIQIKANLTPPPGPILPGGYDFGRDLYFKQIGAVGYSYSPITLLDAGDFVSRPLPPVGERFLSFLYRLWHEGRAKVSQRLYTQMPQQAAGLTQTLLLGGQGAISTDDQNAIRAAGLSHLLAISGLHTSLVAGGCFWLLRAFLAAIPFCAINWPVKAIAAFFAMLLSGFYTVFAGAPVSALRAWAMGALFLVALIIGRRAVSLRSLMIAAFILMFFQPFALLGPSFQMSFAAVGALILLYEGQHRSQIKLQGASWVMRFLAVILWMMIGSLAATLATAPFSLYHFNQWVNYGVIANLLAIPLFTFWLMPLAFFALILMPLGVEAPLLWLLTQGFEVFLSWAHWVASWPYALLYKPSPPPLSLAFIVLAGLWLAIWQGRWRYGAILPLSMGLWYYWQAPMPQLIVLPQGGVAWQEAGRFYMWPYNNRSFAARALSRQLGMGEAGAAAFGGPGDLADDARLHEAAPLAGKIGAKPLKHKKQAPLWPNWPGWQCDGGGCTHKGPPLIGIFWSYEALLESCFEALEWEILIAAELIIPQECRHQVRWPVDRGWLLREGASSFYPIAPTGLRSSSQIIRRGDMASADQNKGAGQELYEDLYKVYTVRQSQGFWPWSRLAWGEK
jgi:competence protein ComEC